MEGAGWISLFRRIPFEHQNSLVLMTINGSEIVIQRLLRLEHDFLAVVGRLGGSNEQGKVLLIPYDQLTYLSLSKKLDESELQALLGGAAVAPAPVEAMAPVAAVLADVAAVVGDSAAPSKVVAIPVERTSIAANANQTMSKNSPPSKSILLARLRQRLADDATKQQRA